MTVTEAWCRTYTRLVPEDVAARRRAEIASYVHEAQREGVSPLRLAKETGLGAAADLAWTDGVRRRSGAVPLVVLPLVDAAVGASLAGLVVLLRLLLGVLTVEPVAQVGYLFDGAALILLLSGHVAGLRRRRRP